MSPEEKIFASAAPLGTAERTAYLDQACACQPALRVRIEALLRAHDADGFMTESSTGDCGPLGAEAAPDFQPEQSGTRIGHYQLIRQIGEGGFGTVWMAEQVEPVTRQVALKIIKAGMDTREVIARFEAERQALAMMDHANIARVFDAGSTAQGRPYFAMELVKGIRITRFCDEQEFTTRQRLELFADVCSAINHAHQKGIIHRDIKPSNVMVSLNGDRPVVKVIDFGIAKATEGRLSSNTLLTRPDQFVGTPAYMSPEQAPLSGLDIDTRCDIYALGILLYELLTGTPPFDGKTLLSAGYEQMRRTICEVDPQKPSSRLQTLSGDERRFLAKARKLAPEKLRRLIHPDLDRIVMKAIEKDRTRRYETANGLALDIRRFLAGESVSATPPSPGYRIRRYIARNKSALRVATALALVLVSATALSSWLAVRALSEQRKAEAQTKRAEQEEAMARSATERFRNQLGEAAKSDRAAARHLTSQGQFRDAMVYLARACEYAPDSLAAAEQAVILGNTAAFHPPEGTLESPQPVTGAEYSPDGTRIATVSRDHVIRVWDASTHQLLFEPLTGHHKRIRSIQFSRDGRLIVSASDDKTARVWDAENGQCLHVLRGHTGILLSAQFNPDSSRVVTTSEDDTARVWNFYKDETALPLAGHTGNVNTAEFSSDGSRIVTASDDKTARIWDAVTGEHLHILNGHEPGADTVDTLRGNEAEVNTARFSPDGTRIVTASNDNTARLWDAATGRLLFPLPGHQDRVRDAGFSPDGTLILTHSEDKTACVWDAGNGHLLHTLNGHADYLRSARFSRDGVRIVTTSDDKTARVWTTATGGLVAVLSGHQQRVWNGDFSPDGSQVVTSSDDGSACIWNLTCNRPSVTLPGQLHRAWKGRISTGGRYVVTTCDDPLPQPEPVPTSQSPLPLYTAQDWLWSAVFSSDSTRVITPSEDGGAWVWDSTTGILVAALSSPRNGNKPPPPNLTLPPTPNSNVRVWDVPSGQPAITLEVSVGPVYDIQISPDGTRIVTAAQDGIGQVWDSRTGQCLFTLPGHKATLRSAIFSPRGNTLLTTSDDYTARIWDASTGKYLHTLPHHTGTVRIGCYSPDGTRIVTASDDHTGRVWDAATGRQIADLIGHTSRLEGAEFNPSGSQILTWSDDKTARIWDARTGQPLLTLDQDVRGVRDAHFSPDGRRIVTASEDRSARIWDASNGRLIAMASDPEPGPPVGSAQYSPDGKNLVTSSGDGTARIWEMPGTAEPPPSWFPDFLRVIASGSFNADGEPAGLPAPARMALRARVLPAVKAEQSRYGDIARYYLTAGPDKPVRPGARITCHEAAGLLISPHAGRTQLEKAYALDPAHPLIHIALAGFASSETQAGFLRHYGIGKLSPSTPAATLQMAAALLAAQPGQEAKQSLLSQWIEQQR